MSGTRSTDVLGLGLVLVLATAVVSGISTFVNIYAVAGTSSDAFVTARNLVVAALLVPVAIAFRPRSSRRTPLRPSDWARLAAIGLIGGAIPFLLFFHGLQLATADHGGTTASFFYRTLFLFATVFAIIYLKERFHWRVVAGAALLLGGSYLLLSISSPVWTDGTIYVLAATVLWAVEYTLSKRAMARLPSTTVALGRMGLGAVFLSVYLAATAQWGAVGHFSGAQWTWVAISAGLLTGFVALWYAGLSKVDLSVASAVLVLGFPITWLLSIGISGTAYTVGQALGTIAVFAGVGVVVGWLSWGEIWNWARRGFPSSGPTSP